jgi:hypothetical protein
LKGEKGFSSLIIFWGVTFLPIVFFLINLREDFGSLSFVRYISLGSFVIPYGYLFLKDDSDSRIYDVLSTILMIVLSFLTIFIIYFRYGMDLKWTINDGKYSTPLSKYYNIAEKAKEAAGDRKKIIVVDSLDEVFTNLANMDNPGIIVRYYLEEYSVGRQYSLSLDQFEEYVENSVKPDYLLILEYDGYFPSCNSLLSIGGSYLIPYRLNTQLFSEGECFFNQEEVINLEK